MKRFLLIATLALGLVPLGQYARAHGDDEHVSSQSLPADEEHGRTYVVPTDDDDLDEGFVMVREIDRIEQAAHRLENAAAHVHRLAERQAHHFDRDEDIALRRLHSLEQLASRFHDYVESSRENPRRTARMFQRLLRTYGQAANAMDELHGHRNVYSAFADVQRSLDDLAYYYGGLDRHGYHHTGRGYVLEGPDLIVGLGPLRFSVD